MATFISSLRGRSLSVPHAGGRCPGATRKYGTFPRVCRDAPSGEEI